MNPSQFMFRSGSSGVVSVNNIVSRQTKRGIEFLMEWVATDAFHNSNELYDVPKCHPHTRVAILEDIMKWVKAGEAQNDFVMWLFGPAGAGKSAIARTIAELAAQQGHLIGTFFFSRTSATRSTRDRLIPTLAYQLALSIPDTRSVILEAIERDPAIFNKNLEIQIDTLLVKPFQSVQTKIVPSHKLVIIDGLDECNDSKAQVAILNAISHSFFFFLNHNLHIKFLVVSRPEVDLVTSFNGNDPLKFVHRRLALDDTYHPDDDIRRFFSDKFKEIQFNHRLRSTIPTPWPSEEFLESLVKKSSGQFIIAATLVKFVESNRHRPVARLNIIFEVSPSALSPFAELDALYNQILSSVNDITLTLRVLSLYTVAPDLAKRLGKSAEQFLSLEEGDIYVALTNLSSIVSYNKSSGEVKILHAPLVDFLSDKRRSNKFYIDMGIVCTDFLRRILQYIKGPDGLQAGDFELFYELNHMRGWIPSSQLKSDILDFDLDAFITAVTYRYRYEKLGSGIISRIYSTWTGTLIKAGLQSGEAIMVNESSESAPVLLELPVEQPGILERTGSSITEFLISATETTASQANATTEPFEDPKCSMETPEIEGISETHSQVSLADVQVLPETKDNLVQDLEEPVNSHMEVEESVSTTEPLVAEIAPAISELETVISEELQTENDSIAQAAENPPPPTDNVIQEKAVIVAEESSTAEPSVTEMVSVVSEPVTVVDEELDHPIQKEAVVPIANVKETVESLSKDEPSRTDTHVVSEPATVLVPEVEDNTQAEEEAVENSSTAKPPVAEIVPVVSELPTEVPEEPQIKNDSIAQAEDLAPPTDDLAKEEASGKTHITLLAL